MKKEPFSQMYQQLRIIIGIVSSLLTPVVIICVLLSVITVPVSTFSYNWSWDQGHDTANDEDDEEDDEDDDCGENMCCFQCPVYVGSGSYHINEKDITLPGKGPGISVERRWTSSDPASGLLGRKWTFNFGRNLIPVAGNDGNEYLVVRRPSGQEVKMVRSGGEYLFTGDNQYSFSVSVSGEGWRLVEKKDQTVYNYDSEGRLQTVIDRNGLAATLSYNESSGCISRVTNAGGNYIDFTLNPNGKIATLSDNLGRSIQYEYDDNGNLVTVSFSDGSELSYTYNDQNLMTAHTNRRGQEIMNIVYNSDNKVIQYTERGETFTFLYEDENKISRKSDSKGRTWTFEYDDNGFRIQDIDPLGNIHSREPSALAGLDGFNWIRDANGNQTNFSFDNNGNKTSKTDPEGNTEYWSYNDDHLVTEYTNTAGVITRNEYDANGNVTQKKEAAGTDNERIWTYTYDEQGNMLTATNPVNATTTWEYDTQGNKVREIGPMGEETTWTYDVFGNMLTMTNPLSYTWIYTYDERGNRLTETDPLEHTAAWEYDTDNNCTAEIDKLGNRTEYFYDVWNRLIKTVGPVDDTTIQEWMAIGDESYESAVRSAEGHWTYYQYDNAGHRIKKIEKMNDISQTPDNDDLIVSYSYDPEGNLLKITNPEGDTMGFGYDSNNRQITKCNGEGECWEYIYDACDECGNVTEILEPNGNRIVHEYDEHKQLIKTTDNLGTLTEKRYDKLGNLVWDHTPGRGAIMYEYDIAGKVVRKYDSTGVGHRFTYDIAGNKITETDSLGNINEYGYDQIGNVIWTRNALGDSVKSQYDANSRIVAMIDPDGNTTTFSFNATGRIVATIYPNNDIDSIYYNKAGLIIRKKDHNEIYTDFIYDDAERIINKTYSDGITPADNFTYDKNSRLISANNSVAQLSCQYDNTTRPVRYVQVVDGITDVIEYDYDIENRLESIIYPDGMLLENKKDFRNRLDSIKINSSLIVAYFDYQDTMLSQKTFYNGITSNCSYDKAGRLSQLVFSGGVSDILPSFFYGYDLAGNKRYVQKDHQPDMSEVYEYDATYQLKKWGRGAISFTDTMVHSPNYYQEWVLDSRGNWEVFDDNGSIQNRTYNNVNELISIGASDITYDKNGNLTSNNGVNYTWNANNQLSEKGDTKYFYDALSRRIKRENADGTTDKFILDEWRTISEISSGGTKQNFIFGDYIDDLTCVVTDVDTFVVINNHQYSAVDVFNKDGMSVEYYEYTPFGNRKIFSPTGENIDVSSIGNNIGFTGRELDEDGELYYYRERNYNPELGRFISEDPMTVSADRNNFYRYTYNNPVKYTDPFGLDVVLGAKCYSEGQRATSHSYSACKLKGCFSGYGTQKRMGPAICTKGFWGGRRWRQTGIWKKVGGCKKKDPRNRHNW